MGRIEPLRQQRLDLKGGYKMNGKEVFAIFLGIIGFFLLREIYLGTSYMSPNGGDYRYLVFALGMTLWASFGIMLGQENR